MLKELAPEVRERAASTGNKAGSVIAPVKLVMSLEISGHVPIQNETDPKEEFSCKA